MHGLYCCCLYKATKTEAKAKGLAACLAAAHGHMVLYINNNVF